MRTTVSLEPDVLKAVERLRHDRELGLSEAINELVRRGLGVAQTDTEYTLETRPLGAKVDISNIGDVLDLLDAE